VLVEARLRAFAAVARRRSFSGAAEELYVSQPAVSKHVAALEAELGKQLVVRGSRGATLTPAGELLADYVLRAEALLANAGRALSTGEDADTGVLALAASGIPGTYLLPDVLARFHERHPGVEVAFELSTSGGTLELVRAHRVELGIVGGMTVPHELEAEPVVDDEVVLVGPPALARRRLGPAELDGLTWVMREEGSSTRAAVEAARWQMGLHSVRVLALPSWEAVKLAVARGAGIAPISRFALGLELEAGALAVLDVPRWRLQRTVSIVTARGVPLTAPAQRFLELVREAFAPVAEAPSNSNLPAPPTPLVGRERELTAVTERIERGGARLVTLTGAGGSGKTRLAIAAAAQLAATFPDGVYLVELAALRDARLVRASIALGLGADPAALAERLAGRRLLLVLDNLEQLANGAAVVADLLGEFEELVVLATSRSPLRLAAEHEVAVPPLDEPDAELLFVTRATAADSAFAPDEAVTEICRRLDYLPLAIELAAARADVLTARALLERLRRSPLDLAEGPRDAPERQRTLHATIVWSEELLAVEGRRLFAALGAFRGGWEVDAAERIAGATLDGLASLVAHGLVRRDAERMSMLETVAEVARERLDVLPERDAIAEAHASFFVDLARTAGAHARGPDEAVWLDRLEVDIDNVRAALEWSIGAVRPDLGLALADALEPLWVRRRYHPEGIRWLEQLLDLSGEVDDGVRAGALALAGRLAIELGDVARAASWYGAGADAAERAGEPERLAWVEHGRGVVAQARGDLDAARAHLEESARLFGKLGLDAPMAGRNTYLCELEIGAGNLDAAERHARIAIDGYARAGDHDGVAGAYHSTGEVALRRRDLDGAFEEFRLGLATPGATDPFTFAHLLAGVAAVAARRGHTREAALLWGAVERVEEGSHRPIAERALYEDALGEPAEGAVAEGRALDLEAAIGLALSL
jgi:DNA-binding transcriptional LysR family regulator/predicted ATPase